jgi:hypothetical protein
MFQNDGFTGSGLVLSWEGQGQTSLRTRILEWLAMIGVNATGVFEPADANNVLITLLTTSIQLFIDRCDRGVADERDLKIPPFLLQFGRILGFRPGMSGLAREAITVPLVAVTRGIDERDQHGPARDFTQHLGVLRAVIVVPHKGVGR